MLAASFFGVGVDAIGLSWQAADPRILPVTVFCLSMAFFLGMGAGAVFKLVPALFPDSRGAVTGIVGAIGGLGGFFPPLLLGIVYDATGEYALLRLPRRVRLAGRGPGARDACHRRRPGSRARRAGSVVLRSHCRAHC